jgi:sugar phosphate isomerase/epimerase
MMNRRAALKTLAVGAALPVLGSGAQAAEAKTLGAARPGFNLGVATVTLKSLPLDHMLAAVKRVGLDAISLHRAHSPWENQPGQWTEIAAKIRAAGVTPRCCGVLYLKNDEAAMRRMMDYVGALGIRFFSCSVEQGGLPLLERLVQEYDFRAAIHNHGPEDKAWPGPRRVWDAIAPLDARIGLCLDIGHSWRAGEDPVEAVHLYRSRLYDVHLKDSVAEVGKEDIPVEMGRGKLDLRNVLTALIETDYRENVWFEYEKDPNDPVTGLAESVGYVRGLLRGLSPV